MKLTLKENEINAKSLMIKHDILMKSTGLVSGREGVLETEKELYLMIAFVDTFVEENLIELCNQDERSLNDIIVQDIEPIYIELMKDEEKLHLYNETKELLLKRCKEIWDNQHSIIGAIDAVLTMISSMSEENKKEALVATGKIAEKVFEKRTELMSEKVDITNSKLDELMKKYKTSIETEDNAE